MGYQGCANFLYSVPARKEAAMDRAQMTDLKNRLDEIYRQITITDRSLLKCEFGESIFDSVDELVKAYEATDYPNAILHLSAGVDALKVGCLFGILLWSTKDEGSTVQACRRAWLTQQDERAIEVALSVADAFPVQDLDVFQRMLNEIQTTFPKLESLCHFWILAIQRIRENERKNSPPDIWTSMKTLFQKILVKK